MDVTISDARKRLGALIEHIEQGGAVTITRRGKPVAKLVRTPPPIDWEKAREAARELIEASKGITLGGLKIKDLTHGSLD